MIVSYAMITTALRFLCLFIHSLRLAMNAVEVALMNAFKSCSLPEYGYYRVAGSHTIHLI